MPVLSFDIHKWRLQHSDPINKEHLPDTRKMFFCCFLLFDKNLLRSKAFTLSTVPNTPFCFYTELCLFNGETFGSLKKMKTEMNRDIFSKVNVQYVEGLCVSVHNDAITTRTFACLSETDKFSTSFIFKIS